MRRTDYEQGNLEFLLVDLTRLEHSGYPCCRLEVLLSLLLLQRLLVDKVLAGELLEGDCKSREEVKTASVSRQAKNRRKRETH